jgi:hypothetical protein
LAIHQAAGHEAATAHESDPVDRSKVREAIRRTFKRRPSLADEERIIKGAERLRDIRLSEESAPSEKQAHDHLAKIRKHAKELLGLL